MRGRKVVSGRSSTVSSAQRTRISGAGGFAASDPVHEKGKFDPNVPPCTGCGCFITDDVRALQCDRCKAVVKWKCADCLCISPEVYGGLEECKEICWMCSDCSGKVLENKGGEDKVLAMLEKLMDKIYGLEERMQQKVDVKKLEELESNMNKWLQQTADLMTLDEREGRIDQSIEEKLKEKVDVKEMEEMCNKL